MTDVNTTGSALKFDKRDLSIRGVQGLPRAIKERLSAKGKELFKATVFGRWLDFEYDPPESGLVDIVLQQRVKEDLPHQLIFKVGNQESYFRRQEFLIMTGFRFSTEQSLDETDAVAGTSRIREIFKDIEGSLKILDLEERFYKDKFIKETDDFDVVSISLLLLLMLFFEGKRKEAVVPDNYIKLVEDRSALNSFPWGSHLWDITFRNLDSASKDIKAKKRLSLDGFVFAFQMWIFEVFPVARKFPHKEGSEGVIPRTIKWKKTKNIGHRNWLNFFEDEFKTADTVENLTPTDAEASCDWWTDSLEFFNDTEDDSVSNAVRKSEDMVFERDAQRDAEKDAQRDAEKDARIAFLEASLASSQASVASLEASLASSQASVASLQASLASSEASLASSEVSLATLQVYNFAFVETVRSFVTVEEPPRTEETVRSFVTVEETPPFPFDVSDEESPQTAISWPTDGTLTLDWVMKLMFKLDWASKNLQPVELPTVLPMEVLLKIVTSASRLFHKEANCVLVRPPPPVTGSTVVVVGDLHGQLHDLLKLLSEKEAGLPRDEKFFVFNGDYVDRGAWGVETFSILLAWKVLFPQRVFLLRGNHETTYCALKYGFKSEVLKKYGTKSEGKCISDGQKAYNTFKECFKTLPVASVIADRVFTCHGGLFRKYKDYSLNPESIGSLEDIRKVSRRAYDPHKTLVADLLWSDPKKEDGLAFNEGRQMGLLWGPDYTERSHEGPDARDGRDDFEGMGEGYTIDHEVPSGKLVTLFSAPDYPQFIKETMERFNNKGAYIFLKPPYFDQCEFHNFYAVTPRPAAEAYYELDTSDSDAEIDEDELNQESGSESQASGSEDSDVEPI